MHDAEPNHSHDAPSQKRRPIESEECLMGIIGSATDAIITVDDEQKITLFNAAAERMFGCPVAQAIGQSIDRFIPHRFREVHSQHIRVFGETGVTRAMASPRPLTALRADGLEFPVEATISQIVVAGQRLFTAIVRDVSERQRAEAELEESQMRTRFAMEIMEVGEWDLNLNDGTAHRSLQHDRIFGYESLLPLWTYEMFLAHVLPEDREGVDQAWHEAMATRQTWDFECRIVRRDRAVRWIKAAGRHFDRGKAGHLVGVVQDITERKRAEEMQAKLAAIVESSDDAIIGKTLDGIIATWNGGAQRIFGYTADEAVGRPISLVIPPDRQHEEPEILQRLARGESIEHFETVRVAKNGREIDVSLTVSPIRNSSGRVVGASKIVRDITARKRSEESLARHAEELARSNLELERFAYVASHDLQEPMRTVQSFAQLLQRDRGSVLSKDAEEYFRYIVGGVQRMQALINDLLAYSRIGSQGGAFAPADCSDICAKVLDNLRASIDANQASVTVDPLPVVIGDATQLGQVFQNLLVNAIKFRGQRTPVIRVGAKEASGEWVLWVTDNGIGIASEFFERIFIIFQRLHTIEEYGGTGIGLAICKKVAERHGGRVWVESVVGEGSTFYFTIPKREKAT